MCFSSLHEIRNSLDVVAHMFVEWPPGILITDMRRCVERPFFSICRIVCESVIYNLVHTIYKDGVCCDFDLFQCFCKSRESKPCKAFVGNNRLVINIPCRACQSSVDCIDCIFIKIRETFSFRNICSTISL